MIDTWAGQSQFDYAGSVVTGTNITYGNNRSVKITVRQYQALLDHFNGLLVSVAPSRTDHGVGSLEEWLNQNVARTAIASYVAPILIREGFATRTNDNKLRF